MKRKSPPVGNIKKKDRITIKIKAIRTNLLMKE